MNASEAKIKLEKLLHGEFPYIFQQLDLDLRTKHLSFKMDSKSYELQMTLKFEENFCDIMCFISPPVLDKNSGHYDGVLKAVNYINTYVKGFGRFVLESYDDTDLCDIAYSLRMQYSLLEKMPEMFMAQLTLCVQYWEDVFTLLLAAAKGEKDHAYIEAFVDDMWG